MIEVNRCHCTNIVKAVSYTYVSSHRENVTTLFGFSCALLSFALEMANSSRCSLAAPMESAGPNLECELAFSLLPHGQRHDLTCVFCERLFLVSWEQLPSLFTVMSAVCNTCLAWQLQAGALLLLRRN